jgi:hypothetical protein
MNTGVFVLIDGDRRQLATIDDMLYGSHAVQREVGLDLFNLIRDVVSDKASSLEDESEYAKVVLFIKV